MKFLKFLVFFIVFVNAGLFISGMLFGNGKSRDRKPLEFPFGEMQDPYKTKYDPIVRLRLKNGFCSGWIVDKHYAVTAAHCINENGYIDESPIKIFDDNGANTFTLAQAVGYDQRTDLGLLSGNFEEFIPLKTNFEQEGFPRDGNKHYLSCGFPLGQKKLSCTEFIPTQTAIFAIAGYSHLIPGMSGGPVIDYDTRSAVAVNTAVAGDLAIVSPLQGFLGLFRLED